MKKIYLIAASMLVMGFTNAQDVHFAQFNFSPLVINPGNAGAEYDIRFTMNYRNQWSSVASPFQTIAGAYDMRITEIGEGFLAGGINFYNDKAGASKMGTTLGNLSLAYHLNLDKNNTLGLGVSGGYGQRFLKGDALTWGNQYDGYDYNSSMPSGESAVGSLTKGFLDISTGLVYTFKKTERYITGNDQMGVNIGVGMSHVHQPDISFYGGQAEPYYRKFVVHGNGLFGISNSRISLAPGFMLAFQGPSKEILFGTNVRYRLQEDSKYTGFISGASLSLGTWYRNNDAVVFTTLIQFSGYALGFSYDLNISDLSQASDGKGGFELSFRYVYPNGATSKAGTTRFL